MINSSAKMTPLTSRLVLCIFLTLISSLIETQEALAQIIPDNSLGVENSTTRPDTIKNTPSDVIEGGASRGNNLFHSFREFSIQEGRGAYFANPDAIQNIFTRVTGGRVSNILGTLGVLGNANLFLINPNGIIFGPNARLDLQGAFMGSTADSLIFDNNFEFSATHPNAPPLLTVNIPIGLRFREKAADISSTATLITPGNLTLQAGNLNLSGIIVLGGDLKLEALETLTIRDSILGLLTTQTSGNISNLSIEANQITIVESRLDTSNEEIGNAGHISIKAVDGVSLVDTNLLAIVSPSVVGNGGDVVITVDKGAVSFNNSDISTNTYTQDRKSGDINIAAHSLSLLNGSDLSSFGRSGVTAGNVTIMANEFVTLNQDSSIDVSASASASSGNVLINTRQLSVRNGSSIFGTVSGDQAGGRLTINASETVEVIGAKETSPGIFTGSNLSMTTLGNGDAGQITINTKKLVVQEGATILTSALTTQSSIGSGGLILINASESVEIKGRTPDKLSFSAISSDTRGKSNAGDISINTGRLVISDGARISSFTLNSSGRGGRVEINATESVELVGAPLPATTLATGIDTNSDGTGIAGDIKVVTGRLLLREGAAITASASGRGRGGNIEIVASESVTIIGTNQRNPSDFRNSRLLAQTEGQGDAGNIFINTPIANLEQGAIVSARTISAGNGGSITVDATSGVTLGNNSQLTVTTSNAGKAGKIEITSDSITIGTNAQLSATATKDATNLEGGGSITLNASNLNIAGQLGIFAETQGQSPAGTLTLNPDNLKPNLNIRFIDQGLISASTSASGDGGDINISASDTINVSGNGAIATTTSGTGNAGTINFITNQLNLAEGVGVTASTTGTGNAGNINLNATQINLQQATITAFTNGGGNAGSISVPNAQTINLDNSTISTEIQPQGTATEPSNITLTSEILNLNNNSNITASTAGTGDAGKITLTADNLTSNSGARIETNTSSSGQAGDITLNITDNLNLTNSTIAASTTSNSTGKGGSITINPTNSVNLDQQARISVNSQGQGDGGDISLTSQNLRLNNRSSISATTASGEGGNITLNVSDTIRQRNNSPISATAGGTGNGGNITVNTKFLIGSGNSKITANAFEGTGGNITLTAQGIFRDAESEITASSDLGVDGVVETNTPEVDPSQGLIDLPQNLVDPNSLISQNVCRQGSQSEFTVRGRGGLPSSPEQDRSSDEVTVGLIEATEQESTQVNPTTRTTRKIIPAQGWRRNEKGEVVLVAYPTGDEANRTGNSPITCSSN